MVEEGWLWSLCEGIESCSSLVVVVIIEDEDGNGGCCVGVGFAAVAFEVIGVA
jgi:hypothetical protein